MNISIVFRDAKFKFVLIKKGEKVPFEKDWPNTANYTYSHQKVQEHLKNGGNLGILTGNGLIVFDCDCQESENIARQLPKTLVVGTSTTPEGYRKKHFYFKCPINQKKILKDYDKHLGEIQALGQQCIIPPSMHPSGAKYEIIEYRPIASISKEALLNTVSPFIDIKKEIKRTDDFKEESDPICIEIKKKVRLTDVMKKYGFDLSKNPTKCLWHPSEGEKCFSYNNETNLWNCFHCMRGGSIFHLVMAHEGCSFLDAKEKLMKIGSIKIKDKKPKEDPIEIKKIKNQTSLYISDDKHIYEQIYDKENESRFITLNDGEPKYFDNVGELKPISGDMVKKSVVLLPTGIEDYGTIEELTNELQKHIYKYLDISEDHRIFASYYILLSWVYDKTSTLNYLRALGDWGTGKSRYLDVIGRLCYKPVLVFGALTSAAVYRMLDLWNGTLVLDEADFRQSDEQADIMKILNAGFEKSRSSITRCNPNDVSIIDTFTVYGPKIIASRKTWTDRALETRCLTERLKKTKREDIVPILDDDFFEAEKKLRNKLLKFRFDYYNKIKYEYKPLGIKDLEPRLKQAVASFTVLFHNIPSLMERFKEFIKKYNEELIEERSESMEGVIFQIYINLIGGEEPYITSRKICELARIELGLEKLSVMNVGKILKSLGFESKPEFVDGKTKRVITISEDNLKTLVSRYLPVKHEFRKRMEKETKNDKITGITGITPITLITGITGESDEVPYDKNQKNITALQLLQPYRGGSNQNFKKSEKWSKTPPTPHSDVIPVIGVMEKVQKWRKSTSRLLDVHEDFLKDIFKFTDEEIEQICKEGLAFRPSPGYVKLV